MPFKLNISDKGKAWKLETEDEFLLGKSIGDKFDGKELKPELDGYELEITGGSDIAGFPMKAGIEGIALNRVLLTKGWGMHKQPMKEKKKRSTPKGLRRRKTVRGQTVSEKTVQINLIITKAGSKKLEEVFPEQNKAPEAVSEPKEEAPVSSKQGGDAQQGEQSHSNTESDSKPQEAPKTEEKPVEAPKEESKPEEKAE